MARFYKRVINFVALNKKDKGVYFNLKNNIFALCL